MGEQDKKLDEFTDSTKALLQELAKEREHRKWLGDILKRWAQWTAAVALGISVAWDTLAKLVKGLSQ